MKYKSRCLDQFGHQKSTILSIYSFVESQFQQQILNQWKNPRNFQKWSTILEIVEEFVQQVKYIADLKYKKCEHHQFE